MSCLSSSLEFKVPHLQWCHTCMNRIFTSTNSNVRRCGGPGAVQYVVQPPAAALLAAAPQSEPFARPQAVELHQPGHQILPQLPEHLRSSTAATNPSSGGLARDMDSTSASNLVCRRCTAATPLPPSSSPLTCAHICLQQRVHGRRPREGHRHHRAIPQGLEGRLPGRRRLRPGAPTAATQLIMVVTTRCWVLCIAAGQQQQVDGNNSSSCPLKSLPVPCQDQTLLDALASRPGRWIRSRAAAALLVCSSCAVC